MGLRNGEEESSDKPNSSSSSLNTGNQRWQEVQVMNKEYFGVQFSNTGPEVELDQIRSIESQVGSPLPDSYRDFLMTVNGGSPRPSAFILPIDETIGKEYILQLKDELSVLHHYKDRNERSELIERLRFEENVSIPRRVSELFSIGTEKYDSLERVALNVEHHRLLRPFRTIVIGMDSDDLAICICVEETLYGSVVMLSPPEPLEEGLEHKDLTEGMIAPSFEEFIQGLFPARISVKEGYVVPEKFLNPIDVINNYSE